MELKERNLKLMSILYIMLPVIIFLLGWIQYYISIPIVIISVVIFVKYFKSHKNDLQCIKIQKTGILLIIFLAIIWCFLSGIGKLFYQPTFFYDHIARNSIYKDLIIKPWPVAYDESIYLCYYIGQWMVPSSIGKIFYYITSNEVLAYDFGNVLLYIWCVIGVILLFIWLIKVFKVNHIKKIIFILLLFILFSGLDIIGCYIQNGEMVSNGFENGFEWWVNLAWQYSSFTSLLFWVYNQAIVPMIIFLMVYEENNHKNTCVLLIFGLLFGPYPMLGIVLYLIAKEIIICIKNKTLKNIKQYFSVQNLLSMCIIFPIIVLYYIANYKVFNRAIEYQFEFKIIEYILFIVFEFLIYVVLILKKEKCRDLLIATFFLILFPLIGAPDFVMRTSIPFILILYIYITKFIMDKSSNKYKKGILFILLTIASINPLVEIKRGIHQTILQGYVSKAGEVNIIELPDYYKNNYISVENSFFFKYIGKEVKYEKNT